MPLIGKISDQIITPLIYLLFALALLYFLWGVAEFVRQADNEEARKTGRDHMLWGVIGIFIMVSVYGILHLVCTTIQAGC